MCVHIYGVRNIISRQSVPDNLDLVPVEKRVSSRLGKVGSRVDRWKGR